jgi:ubiquinone biosynthesis protein
MLRDAKHNLRLMYLAFVLARYDALRSFDMISLPLIPRIIYHLVPGKKRGLRAGQRLSLALQKLGPSFIKAGQALSTRGDLIGEKLATDLAELQDSLPPFPTRVAIREIEAQLGAPITEIFSQFDETAIAAASVAQVHFAVTPEGKEVAVKILRPHIEKNFARDIELMRWIAEKLERNKPELKRLKPVAMVNEFARTVSIELDLRLEAAAADELRENTKDDADFYVPAVDWQRTAKRVLVTERIRGISAGDIEGLKASGIDLTATMERAAKAFFNQVFRDGFFHADMHPGNLFVLPDGRLAPVDFGIMGRVDHDNQLILAQILWRFLKGDYHEVARLHREAGYIPAHVSIDQFAQAIRAVGSPIVGKTMNEISVGRLFGQLLTVARMFEMEAQPHLFLLHKTMITAEGVGRSLNPNVNMWQLSEPLIRAWAKEHLSPRARLKAHAKEVVEILRDAPRILQKFKELLNKVDA